MAATQPNYDGPLTFSTTYGHLFGQTGPAIQVIGRKSALDELQKGIEGDGLVARLDQPDHASTALEQSLDILRLKNAFPASEDLLHFAAQSPELQLVGGVSPEDWIIKETIQYAVNPPFHLQQLNVDFLLAFLRVAQTYHNQGRMYQLVILTETYHAAQYHVDLLPTVNQAQPTHSIYLYRSFVWAGGAAPIIEIWRGFGMRPGSKQSKPEIVTPPKYPQDLLQRVKRLREKQATLQD